MAIDKYEGGGTSDMTADLTGLAPKAIIAMTSRVAMTVKVRGQTVPAVTKNDFRIEMTLQK